MKLMTNPSVLVLILSGGILVSGSCKKTIPPPAGEAFRGYMYGLLCRDVTKLKTEESTKIAGFVAQLSWSDAQPQQNGAISSKALNFLDSVSQVAKANHYDQIQLRFLAGIHAPDWAKSLGGGPINDWTNPQDGEKYTIPVWFSDQFLAAYDDVISKLATLLADRLIFKEVTCSGATTIFAEPCIKQFGNAANRSNAIRLGYSLEKDIAAFKKVMAIHHQYMTPIGIVSSVAYNPYQYIDPSGNSQTSLSITQDLMNYQVSLLGKFGVWENNSLGARENGNTFE